MAFKEPDEADMCQTALNGRWFGGRKLSAQLWDGVTDYQVEETSREREERLKGWGSFLGDEKASAEDNADPSKAAEQQNSSIQAAAEQNRQQEQANESTATPQEGKDEKDEEEEGVESTDSSLAGSDNEDA